MRVIAWWLPPSPAGHPVHQKAGSPIEECNYLAQEPWPFVMSSLSKRCKEKLDTLAISVMNMYPGVKLRVTEAWDDEGYHAPQSLHNEGRAVDITTSDRDRSKYGMLARLAVEAGFDFVYYESRGHIHCSVKPESAEARSGGCFSSNSLVQTETGRKRMSELHLGDRVLVITPEGQLDYSEVILFLDRDENNTRTYLSIETESGAKITLTPVHLIFTETNNTTTGEWGSYTTYAKNVQIGHYVYVVSHSASPEIGQQLILDKVVNITVATEGGVYAPLTQHGNVVVNDVVASCYAVMSDQKIAHWAFFPMRILHNFKQACRIALQKLHLVQLRTPKTKRNDQDTGIHWYATFLYTLTRTLFPRYLYT
ncbi:sonic hedgehog protein [Nephila pilipes]|uniref:Protein hedgehog n=1 Tax=Nephila pilipes TaxID=299642 RepID=A0A8X6PTM1_NEPPI|nr:sonic hedgehog protein [Nephila pilipes]